MRRLSHLRRVLWSATAATLLCAGMVGVAQVSVAPVSGGASASEKHLAFEVISIRRNNAVSGRAQFGFTPDGFHPIDLPMAGIFSDGYAPSNDSGVLRGDRILGVLDWLKGERYDVVAKVDEGDLAAGRSLS
jgi:hypothetical protein